MKPYAGNDFEEHRGLGKKDREKLIVSGVLERLGFFEFQLRLQERPDALVDFRDASGSVRLGLPFTHTPDELPGPPSRAGFPVGGAADTCGTPALGRDTSWWWQTCRIG